MEFLWEVFNLTNSVLFAQSHTTLTDSSVGTITSLAGDPRIMQFTLRLSFWAFYRGGSPASGTRTPPASLQHMATKPPQCGRQGIPGCFLLDVHGFLRG